MPTTSRRAIAVIAAMAVLLAWHASSRAATMIDGGSVGGQVWTSAGSPYLVRAVNGPLSVPSGSELRIESGTVVLFSSSHGQSSVNVAGALTIIGTADRPVVLQGELGGVDQVWSGIDTTTCEASGLCTDHGTAVVRIKGAIIRNAKRGLIVSKSFDVSVDQTTFESCTIGLTVYNSSISEKKHVFDSIIARNNSKGIEVNERATVTITNALLQANTSTGVAAYGASLTIVNSTVDGNSIGVLGVENGPLAFDIENTILSNNVRAIDLSITEPPAMVVNHSTFWGNVVANVAVSMRKPEGGDVKTASTNAPPGTGNVVADPRFRSATDRRLADGSPCIDSGAAQRAPDHDLDGIPRPQGSSVDRGAFEFHRTAGGMGGAGGSDRGGTGGAGGTTASGSGGAGGGSIGASGGAAGAGDGAGGRKGAAGGTAGGGSAGTSAGVTGTGGATSGDPVGGADAGFPGAGGQGGNGASDPGATGRGDGCGCDLGGPAAGYGGPGILTAAIAWALGRRRRPPPSRLRARLAMHAERPK